MLSRDSAPFGDLYLASYSVSCERREIRMVAKSDPRDEPLVTEIIFTDVVAYFFEHDNFSSILGWIIERPLTGFLRQHAEDFERGSTESGWPRSWRGSVEDYISELQASSTLAFEIQSSYGIGGWVLARDYETRAVATPIT